MAKKSILQSHVNPFSILRSYYRLGEEQLIPELLKEAALLPEQLEAVQQTARQLIEGVRKKKVKAISVENFLQTYDLSSEEGLALMCLAEALLRIPDEQTQIKLIQDKISSVDWGDNIGKVDSFAMNIATLGLATTDMMLRWGLDKSGFIGALGSIGRKMTQPVIRQSINQAMKMLGQQFVMGETIEKAVERAQPGEVKGFRHSYDMLGEGAKTSADAERYFNAYCQGIEVVATHRNQGNIFDQPSISVKLSALHPRYELVQKDRVFKELYPKIHELCLLAKQKEIALTIDAEESERLEISLEIIEHLCQSPQLSDWNGLGLAVQAYQKRAPAVIDWIVSIARKYQRRFSVRLVKGAYWDSEIKKTQEKGLSDYPVYSRKVYTDISYLVCVKRMLQHQAEIYSQFATHNAYTVATIMELAKHYQADYEFQRLHGMGEPLYEQFVTPATPCRIYAPVGQHRDLLAYLVRRLLENGANTSFVNKIHDTSIPVESLLVDPIAEAHKLKTIAHPHILNPKALFLPTRLNSQGLDLSNPIVLDELSRYFQKFTKQKPIMAVPSTLANTEANRITYEIKDPGNRDYCIGSCTLASDEDLKLAVRQAEEAFSSWTLTPVSERANLLDKLADKLEENYFEFISLLVYESGKTVNDAIAEIREAADFCRYYANQARLTLKTPQALPGPTGEHNELSLHGRGVFVCISPWNFPLAIFLGQVAAALVTGNTVIAKPAQQTPLVAYKVCQLAHHLGISRHVLHFMPAKGSAISSVVLSDACIAGVAFTGSTEVAWTLNQTLSARQAAIAPLIAETGGINAMIVDSSALPEQVVTDVIASAFQSAGQRCSALRLLFIQDDVAERTLEMLAGAMQELKIGHPALFSSDIGPVIDSSARAHLEKHLMHLQETGELISMTPAATNEHEGNYFQPQAWELPTATALTTEVFGPILHVVRFKAENLDATVTQINSKGFGLTLGVHSRIDKTVELIRKHARVGNLYVNRNMIGAVVGVQPFGGEGLSGTGPKAGGPHYLLRFCVERTFTQDTTAAGGNASLLATMG